MASQPTPATAYGTSTALPGAQAQAGGAKCRGTKVRFEAYQVNRDHWPCLTSGYAASVTGALSCAMCEVSHG
jgi:hypothetical protein